MIIGMLMTWGQEQRNSEKTLIHHSLEYMRKNQPKLKDTITEMKNILEGNYTKLDDTEYVNNMEDRLVDITNQNRKKKRKEKKERKNE